MTVKIRYVVTDKQRHAISRRMTEIRRRLNIEDGSVLDSEKVTRIFQELINSKCEDILNFESQRFLPFAEEIKLDHGYPEGFRIRTPEEQLRVWKKYFPKLDASRVLEQLADNLSPDAAEGWAVIPKPSKMGESSLDALNKILGLIAESRKFKNWREGKLGPEYLRLVKKTQQALDELEKETPADFLVFPFQFGLHRRARVYFSGTEFGLGPYEVAALLVIHPDRITGPGEVHADCAGCEYAPEADNIFRCSLSFRWAVGHECLGLYSYRRDIVRSNFGALSGFRL